MKILYDHQIFSAARYSGISRYFCQLFYEFSALGIEWQVSAPFSNNLYLQELSPRPKFFPNLELRGKNRILELVNYFGTRYQLALGNFDLFHSTYSKPYDNALFHGKPYVITVHDLTHEKFTDLLPSAPREVAEERLSIARADAIIVPSYSTRDDLIFFYPQSEHKISVIYHGFRIPKYIPDLFNNIKPYCVYVGTRMLYKDFLTSLVAFATLPERLNLLCIGGGEFTSAEKLRFEQLGLHNRVFHCSADEPTLFSAYAGAEMLLFPSRAEGFGLPIIEAQSMGCVPILADIPCSREIGANGALFFEPGNIEECAKQMRNLLQKKHLKQILISNMHENIKRFSWQEAALKTSALYKLLLD